MALNILNFFSGIGILIMMLLVPQPKLRQTYFISSNGDDTNTGLSPFKSWKTLKNMHPGDTYLFCRGDTFSFPIQKLKNTKQIQTIIGSYGKGPLPVISGYKSIKSVNWNSHSFNIWKLDLRELKKINDGSEVSSTDVGFIKVGDKIFGNKVSTIENLNRQWDFYSDNYNLFVYSNGVPESCEIAVDGCLVSLSNNLLVRDLELIGSGGHAVMGVNVSNVTLKGLTIGEIGGSYLKGFDNGRVRYGNGIELWSGAKNCLIESCSIKMVYDAALTMQGNQDSIVFENVVFKQNVVRSNGQSFEFWCKGQESGFKKCEFVDNSCSNAGFGWGDEWKSNKDVGVQILSYYSSTKYNDLLIKNNSFYNARSGYLWTRGVDKFSFRSENNKVYLDKNIPIKIGEKFRVGDVIEFKRKFNTEVNSGFLRVK